MDIQMPVMDGHQASRKIREHATYKTIPIIAMTANVSPVDILVCQKSGMNAYTAKPIDEEELPPPFIVTLVILKQGISLALILGFIGGFFPALRAARLPVILAFAAAH